MIRHLDHGTEVLFGAQRVVITASSAWTAISILPGVPVPCGPTHDTRPIQPFHILQTPQLKTKQTAAAPPRSDGRILYET